MVPSERVPTPSLPTYPSWSSTTCLRRAPPSYVAEGGTPSKLPLTIRNLSLYHHMIHRPCHDKPSRCHCDVSPPCHCEEGRSPDVAIYNCKFLASCHYSRRILENVGSNLQNHSKRRQFHNYSRSFSRFFGSNPYVIARSRATWQSLHSLYRQIFLYRNLSDFFKK